MRTIKTMVRVFGAISLVSSFAFLALGASCYNRAANFKKTAIEAQGTVIELRESTSGGSHGGSVYNPVVRFADKDGQEHTLYSSTGTYPPAYAVGGRAPVLYDPADPQHAEINSFTGLWLLPLILAGIGGLDLLTGLCLLFVAPHILRWAERRTAPPSSQ
jgi:hypothetical protein